MILEDLYELLKQTQGTGINIYTHGEMLPAHGYPVLKAFPHFVGHYGTAWQNQQKELPGFPGAVLFTTNCIQNPRDYGGQGIHLRHRGLAGPCAYQEPGLRAAHPQGAGTARIRGRRAGQGSDRGLRAQDAAGRRPLRA